MSVIKYQDLFDFDGYEKALAKLESRKASFAQSATKMIGTVEQSYNQLIGKVAELEKKIASVNLGNPSARQQLTDYTKATDEYISRAKKQKETIDLLNGSIQLNEASLKDLKAGLATLKKEYDSLDPKAADFAQQQKAIADRAKEVTQVISSQSQTLRAATKSVDHARNSYHALSKQTGEMKAQLRAMPGAFDATTGAINKHNRAAVELQRQIQRNDAALKKMDASMGNHQRNVGNYGSAISGLGRGLLALSPIALGVGAAVQALTSSLQVIDRMERLSLSLEAASSSTESFLQRQQFIKNLANLTGQEIEKLTESYIQFTAATRNTVLEGVKGDRVFAAFSKSFSALGKSSAVAERGLNAVQQMISKGKVSSEELRQQLGEALPGANKIFADALGISVSKLEDMMKKGELMATDVLPKVAVSLEKTYGDRAQRNLETIGGSWTNLNNQVKFFLDSLNQDGVISKFFARINNGLASVVSRFTAIQTSFGAVQERVATMRANKGPLESFWEGGIIGTAQDYFDAAQQVGRENERIAQSLEKFNKIEGNKARVDAIMKEQIALQSLNKALKQHEESGRDAIIQSSDFKKKTVELSGAIAEQKRLIEELTKAHLNPANPIDNPSGAKPDAPAGGKTKEQTQYEKLLETVEKLRDVLVDDALKDVKAGRAMDLPKETLDKWNRLYATLEKTAELTGTTLPKNLQELNELLNPAQKNLVGDLKIEEAKDTPTKSPKTDKVEDLTNYMGMLAGQEDERNLLERQMQSGLLRRLGTEHKAELTRLLEDIQRLEREGADEQVQQARRVFNEKKRLAEEEVRLREMVRDKTMELGSEVVNGLFELNTAYREQQVEWNQKAMDHELAAAGDNEEAKDRIKQEFAKRDLELRQKQARADKAQALFNIAMSTAQSIMSIFSTGGGTRYADFGASAFTLSAIVGAIGAVQAAAVLAKPLPAFFKGTSYAPEGLATIAEKGPELRESKGKLYYYDTPQVAYLSQGDKVYTAEQTSRMLAEQALRQEDLTHIQQRSAIGHHTSQRIEAGRLQQIKSLQTAPGVDYKRLTQSLVQAFDSRPEVQTIIDDKGQRTRHRRQNHTATYLNKRYGLQ